MDALIFMYVVSTTLSPVMFVLVRIFYQDCDRKALDYASPVCVVSVGCGVLLILRAAWRYVVLNGGF